MFSRDALLLIGHGSTSVPDAARPLLTHADAIRETNRFGEVKAGVLLGEPNAAAVFNSLTAPVIHVVPFFLDDGYFTRIAIPDLLLPLTTGSRVVRFCKPIGSHRGIADLIEERLLRHCELYGNDPKALTVLLVGHGSGKSPGRARSLRKHATTLERGGRFGWVRVAYLEETPLVAEALASARGHVVAVVGYLVNAGAHATRDLPRLLAAERELRGTNWPPVHDLGSIGSDAALSGLIMDLVTVTRHG